MMLSGNPENALIVFAEWASQVLRNLPGPLILVPVPGSKLAIGALPHDVGSKAHLLAEKAAEIIGPKARVADILRFLEPHQSVNQGNSKARDRQWLKNQLRMNNPPNGFQTLPPGQVILVDDVLTSGSHLMACHDFLLSKFSRKSDLKPFALCAARTVKSYVDQPYPYNEIITMN
jgi:predicted amidophosphoribosyltransferase